MNFSVKLNVSLSSIYFCGTKVLSEIFLSSFRFWGLIETLFLFGADMLFSTGALRFWRPNLSFFREFWQCWMFQAPTFLQCVAYLWTTNRKFLLKSDFGGESHCDVCLWKCREGAAVNSVFCVLGNWNKLFVPPNSCGGLSSVQAELAVTCCLRHLILVFSIELQMRNLRMIFSLCFQDQNESAAILKIKETMAEEAKRFEKDTPGDPSHPDYPFMQ